MRDEALMPVLWVRDADAALAWYRRLGFDLEFEHSAGPTLDRTMAIVRRGELGVILSNREQGSKADSLIYLRVTDLRKIETEFEVSATPFFGGEQVELHDPDGNRIRVVTSTLPRRKGRLIGPS